MTKRRVHVEPRRYWTKAEDRIVRRHYPHKATADVAKLLPGRTPLSVYQRAYGLGLNKEGVPGNDPQRKFAVSKDDLRRAERCGCTKIYGLRLVNRSGI